MLQPLSQDFSDPLKERIGTAGSQQMLSVNCRAFSFMAFSVSKAHTQSSETSGCLAARLIHQDFTFWVYSWESIDSFCFIGSEAAQLPQE